GSELPLREESVHLGLPWAARRRGRSGGEPEAGDLLPAAGAGEERDRLVDEELAVRIGLAGRRGQLAIGLARVAASAGQTREDQRVLRALERVLRRARSE